MEGTPLGAQGVQVKRRAVRKPRRKRNVRFALTLVEVLAAGVAVAALSLLIGTAAAHTRSAGRTADCLSNLHQIGLALHAYSTEDPREQAIPIHMNMVRQGVSYWLWRTANWFAWGGQSATEPFLTGVFQWWLSAAPPPPGSTRVSEYDAARRPLNGYCAPGTLDVFRCPADVGYPSDPNVDDSPIQNAGQPCWTTLGSSYRANLAGLSKGQWTPASGYFSFGPLGHARSTLQNPSQLVMAGDPVWFNMIGSDYPDTTIQPIDLPSWHGVPLSDNLLYADGAARLTSAAGAGHFSYITPLRHPDSPDLLRWDRPEIQNWTFLTVGPDWQVGCYPTPGARLFGDWFGYVGTAAWPWKNYYDNPGPLPPPWSGRGEGAGSVSDDGHAAR